MARHACRFFDLCACGLAAALTLLATSLGASAQAEKRIALIIGNSAYQNVPRLANPLNDASAMAEKFKDAGFQVVDTRRDLSNIEMRRAIREFTAASATADIAVIYFAGHGFEVGGTNYLIPVDAKLQTDLDVEDEALSLDRLIKATENAKRLRLIILDACRDNPFLKSMRRTIASRQIASGLASVEPASSDTLIAFAAKAGLTADDGTGKHSPFTIALVNNLFEPGLDIRIALGRVRDEVKRATGNRQEPFTYGSLGGTNVSLVPKAAPKPVVAAPAPAPVENPNADIRRDYELAAQIGTKEAWDLFLGVYKSGFYAELAKAARAKIIAAEKAEAAAAEASARAEAAEKARATNAAAERAKAEAARAVAEKAEKAKVEAAERARAEAQKAAEAQRTVDAQKSAEAQKTQIAALPTDQPDITRALQTELRRVGCHVGAIDGNWSAASQRALEGFNRFAGMKLDAKAATEDALDVVRSKQSRICPLLCERGFRADGERCVAIVCPSGQVLNSSGACEARPKAAAKPEPKRHEAAPARDPTPPRRVNDIPCDRGLPPAAPNSCAAMIGGQR
jgi:uncharacterized caspase-like protein